MMIPPTIARRLAWEGSDNTRDLGGYATRDGRFTRMRRVVRSDSLELLTEQGQADLIAYGVRTIIDLRLPAELERGPNPFAARTDGAVTYLHRSFNQPEQLSELMGAATLAEHYTLNLSGSAPRVAAILEAIAGAPEGAVLIHCQGGQDRTGMISALLLEIAGVPDETIVADYALTAELLRAGNDAYLADGPGERAEREREIAFFTAHPEVIAAALAFLRETFGGVMEYLQQAGVSPETVAALRDRLLAE